MINDFIHNELLKKILHPLDKEFLSYHNKDFVRKYVGLADRFITSKAALNLLNQRGGKVIVETGCVREKDNWADGQSTIVFADYARKHDAHLYTVDIKRENIEVAEEIVGNESVTYTAMDSIKYLESFKKNIDLLYLDSMDNPIQEMLKINKSYGGDIQDLTLDEAVERFGELLLPSQTHCLNELKAALPNLHRDSVVLIDDNWVPGGGKPRLAREWLFDNDWELLADWHQTLWIKK
jgi:hypothetical protein